MGWPTKLIYGQGNLSMIWDMMETGEGHIWPEVWRSESDGENYKSYVLSRETCASAGKRTAIV
jgi:uncharacterized membrane-anchored protein